MAKAKKKRNGSTRLKALVRPPVPKPANDTFASNRPTAERKEHNAFRDAGAAKRVIPVIESLLKDGKLTQPEFDALDHYREQAHKAEDDCAKSSALDPDRISGGGSPGGKIPAILLGTPAILETARLERDLGSLFDIARAVAVDDVTLERWCIAKHGGRERYNGKGEFVALVPDNEKAVGQLALLELRMAARRIYR